jgi:hypothetical protein
MIERSFKEEIEKIAGGKSDFVTKLLKPGLKQSVGIGAAVGGTVGAVTSDDSLSGAIGGATLGAGTGIGVNALKNTHAFKDFVKLMKSKKK